MTTTFDAIRAIIVRDFELPPERLQPDTLLEQIELDSLAITELVFSIEDEFKITAESTIPSFQTLGDIADYVTRLIAERDTKAREAAKPAGVPAKDSARPATPKPPKRARAGAKASRAARNGVPPDGEPARGVVNGAAKKRASRDGRANGAKANGASGARAAKQTARAVPSRETPPPKPKRAAGGRGGARAR